MTIWNKEHQDQAGNTGNFRRRVARPRSIDSADGEGDARGETKSAAKPKAKAKGKAARKKGA